MSVLLPNVGFSAHEASNSSQNPSSNDDPESMKDGNESNYFQPLKKKAKKSYEKVVCFKVHGLVNPHGPN
jgi:hypothetical protein